MDILSGFKAAGITVVGERQLVGVNGLDKDLLIRIIVERLLMEHEGKLSLMPGQRNNCRFSMMLLGNQTKKFCIINGSSRNSTTPEIGICLDTPKNTHERDKLA